MLTHFRHPWPLCQKVVPQIFIDREAREIRSGAPYSTVDGSRQGVFWLVGEKKMFAS